MIEVISEVAFEKSAYDDAFNRHLETKSQNIVLIIGLIDC